MSKFLLTIFCFLSAIMIPMTANAQSINNKLCDGITSDGVTYSVYEIETSHPNVLASKDTIYVVREFQFSGILVPPNQYFWHETVGNVNYSGTLSLINFMFEGGNTIATYEGTLTAHN